MSRSRRKTSISGVVPVASEVFDKRHGHRILRRLAKMTLQSGGDEKPIPILREVSDAWHMAKEGKWYFDPRSDRKRMRK